jgi:hypothetical protein
LWRTITPEFTLSLESLLYTNVSNDARNSFAPRQRSQRQAFAVQASATVSL